MVLFEKIEKLKQYHDESPFPAAIVQLIYNEDTHAPCDLFYVYSNDASAAQWRMRRCDIEGHRISEITQAPVPARWLEWVENVCKSNREEVIPGVEMHRMQYRITEAYRLCEDCCLYLTASIPAAYFKQEAGALHPDLHLDSLYHLLVEEHHLHVWQYDTNTDTLFQDLFPFEHESLFFSPIIHKFPESLIEKGAVRCDSIEPLRALCRKVHEGATRTEADIWLRTGQENTWWCEHMVCLNIRNEHGAIVRTIGTGRDVTDAVRTRGLYEMEMQRHLTAEKGLLCFCTLNLSHRTVVRYDILSPVLLPLPVCSGDSCEKAFAALPQMADLEEEQRALRETFSTETLLRAFENGHVLKKEYRRKSQDGNAHWVESVARALRDPVSGNILAFLYTYDRHEARVLQALTQHILKTEYEMVLLVDILHNTAHILGPTGQWNVISQAGGSPCCTLSDLFSVQCPDSFLASLPLASLEEKLETSDNFSLLYSLESADGERRRKKARFFYIDRSCHLLGIARIDVTDMYEAQDRQNAILSEALERAYHASAAKNDFLSRMSHDMRTPLNTMLGFSDLALGSHDPHEIEDALVQIKSSGKYLLSLINDILDMKKMESGHFTLAPQAVDSAAFLCDFTSSLQPAIDQKQLHFHVIKKNLCLRPILIDPIRTQQLFMNLVSNAIKFTPTGGSITATIEGVARQNHHTRVRFTLEDTGIGMSEDFLSHFFEPFEQERPTTTSQEYGTGLGMSIVQNLVHLMGGEIRVKSRPGKGTTFWVTLDFPWAELPSSSSVLSKENDRIPLEGLRVLLCEDHTANAELISRLLKKRGCIVHVTSNGQEGLDWFSSSALGACDVILMDIRMPVMDGLCATRAIRSLSRPDAHTVPIIALTANAYSDDVRAAKAAGMDFQLTKPVDTALLYKTLASLPRVAAAHTTSSEIPFSPDPSPF